MIIHESTYQEWLAKDLWTIEQAVKLAIGYDPDYWLNGTMIGFEDNEDDVPECIDEEYRKLEELARLSLCAKNLAFETNAESQIDFTASSHTTDEEGFYQESAWARKILVRPHAFIVWAMQKGISVPAQVTAILEDEKILISKHVYDALVENSKKHSETASVPDKDDMKPLSGRPSAREDILETFFERVSQRKEKDVWEEECRQLKNLCPKNSKGEHYDNIRHILPKSLYKFLRDFRDKCSNLSTSSEK